MRYSAAIIINPQWSPEDHELARRLLFRRIAEESGDAIDAVARKAMIEIGKDLDQDCYIAKYKKDPPVLIDWPIG